LTFGPTGQPAEHRGRSPSNNSLTGQTASALRSWSGLDVGVCWGGSDFWEDESFQRSLIVGIRNNRPDLFSTV
jgi:hypothetical protein